jgi:hypothetical protein
MHLYDNIEMPVNEFNVKLRPYWHYDACNNDVQIANSNQEVYHLNVKMTKPKFPDDLGIKHSMPSALNCANR